MIAALGLLLRIWTIYSETIPLWMDELAHGNYVAYIHEHQRIPDMALAGEDVPLGPDRSLLITYENYQPPGYYIIAAICSGGSPLGARWVSVIMFMIALCFVWAASRDQAVACALAFIPGVIYATSVISNDVFLLLGSAILFYACLKKKTWALVLGGIVLATSKFNGVPILAAVGCYYFYKRQYTRAIINGVCTLIGAAIIWWRWDLQVARDVALISTPKVSAVTDYLDQALSTGVMHIAPYELRAFSYILGVVVGMVLVWKAYHRIKKGLPIVNLVVIGTVLLVWVVFSFTRDAWQGRLVYAAIPWLASSDEK